MSNDPFEKLKVAKGETKVIKADLISPMRKKEMQDRSVLAFHEQDGGTVLAVIPDSQLSDLVAAALHATQTARDLLQSGAASGPVVAEISRAIKVDRLQVPSPETSNTPQGHAVLEVWIGDVSIKFCALSRQWKEVLEELTRAEVDHGTAH